jgi:hypothetical protein
LYLDEHGDLYAAWTTASAGLFTYESIHVMRSRDGGVSWQDLEGDSVTLPVVADHSGPTQMVNPGHERGQSPFLANMIVKQGKAHFFYRVNDLPLRPMHYVRFDVVTGVREDDITPFWSGRSYSLNNLDGFCTTRRERLDSTLYCVSKTIDTRLAVLVSTDNGRSWQDYAATGVFPNPNCLGCMYSITGARQITNDGYIIGAFRYDPQQNTPDMEIKFLRVPVPTVSQTRLEPVTVTTSGAASGYPATNAVDNNPATLWVASLAVTGANNNAWIQLDLGSVKEVRKIAWNSPVGAPYPAHGPSHYTVTVSENGVSWTTVANRTWGAGVTGAAEPVYLNTRYIRLTTTMVNDGTGWSLSFYEFWAEGVNPPATTRLPAAVYSGSHASSYPVSNAGDGDPATWYVASSTLQPGNNDAWIELDLGSIKPITRVKWTGGGPLGTPYPGHSPTNYTIQVSNDGINWTILKNRIHSSAVVNGDEVVAVSARYVVLVATKVHDYYSWYAMSFSEFWVEGVEPPITTRLSAVGIYSGSPPTSYPVAYANDLNPATQYVASLTTHILNNDAWIQLDLESVQLIKRVRWIGASGTPFPAHSPANYTIEVSNDRLNWQIVKSRVNANGVVNGDEVLSVSARYIKLVATKVSTTTTRDTR